MTSCCKPVWNLSSPPTRFGVSGAKTGDRATPITQWRHTCIINAADHNAKQSQVNSSKKCIKRPLRSSQLKKHQQSRILNFKLILISHSNLLLLNNVDSTYQVFWSIPLFERNSCRNCMYILSPFFEQSLLIYDSRSETLPVLNHGLTAASRSMPKVKLSTTKPVQSMFFYP